MVKMVAEIRRLHLLRGLATKAIDRGLGFARTAVWEVLRSGATGFRDERAPAHAEAGCIAG